MCRIAGLWDFRYSNQYDFDKVLCNMRDSLSYGGPDSAGAYRDDHVPLGLGHRRLSILDLSDAGRQPMTWNDLVIILNGEVYNFQEVRKDLEVHGYTFHSGSDTEVILKSFEKWGTAAVQRYRGMFAMAIWNKRTQQLSLCRDRIGVKPLYWYYKDGLFLFGSELKAFLQHPVFDKKLQPAATSLFLQQGYIPSSHCIYEYAHKVEPGTFLHIDKGGNIQKETYWSVKTGQSAAKSAAEREEELEALLMESFQLRMVADVPVGMFLSGGVDSSLVTALLQKQSNRPLKTFTIGFHDERYNEAGHAKAVAQHLGTEHTELFCTEDDFKALVPQLPHWYDEPFGDSSGLPTYLVSRMAREHVTVSLSADGGDELFGGYTKYEIARKFYPKINRLPAPLRAMMRGMVNGLDPLWVERNASKLPVIKGYKDVANKFSKFKQALSAKDLTDFFNRSSVFLTPEDAKKLLPEVANRFETNLLPEENHWLSFMGMIDVKTYLEGDIMTKVDRATMQVALEGREPFLDHKVVEYALSLPDEYKINGNSTKHILRKILYKHVPQALIERPKQGFSIPVGDWLRGMLRPELEALQHDKNFLQTFGLNEAETQKYVQNFLTEKKYVNPHFVWFLYSLHQWYRCYL